MSVRVLPDTAAGLESSRPHALVLLDHYLPGYRAGGPIRSISNLVRSLGPEFQFTILTRDHDLGSDEGYGCIVERVIDGARVIYLPSRLMGVIRLVRLVCTIRCDLLYLNSFFSRPFSMLPLLLWSLGLTRCKRMLLAPRGEFSLGALAIRRRAKAAYILFVRALNIYGRVSWHASSACEATDIRRQFGRGCLIEEAVPLAGGANRAKRPGRNRILLAMDLANVPSIRPESGAVPRQPRQALRIVFLSRISPMKNLDGALRILAKVQSNVVFKIYGPVGDEAYWEHCRKLMLTLPPNVAASYCGDVPHHEVAALLQQSDLFFFPTRGENYGHVILEALCAGLPVLISDQTPWRDLEREWAGHDIPLSEAQRFVEVIETYSSMSDGVLELHSDRASAYGLNHANNPRILEENRALLLRAMEE